MSSHYVACAAEKDMPASTKLVLMACADSADSYTRIGMPGFEVIRKWSGLGKSRSMQVLAELIQAGYLVRTASAHRGRRAEYMVFPQGCCASHGPIAGQTANASGPADPKPSEALQPNESATPDPSHNGSDNGSDSPRTPSKLLSALPPNPPTASRPGGRKLRCNPEDPLHPNCRKCRTTPRTLAADTERQRRLSHRAAIDNCNRCDHNGQVEDDRGRMRRCACQAASA